MRFIRGSVVFTVFILLFFRSNVKAIFDATEAPAAQFPYHVAITVLRNTTIYHTYEHSTSTHTSLTASIVTKWYCSGAIISSKSVITSYKCVMGSNFNGSWVGARFRIQTDCLRYMNEDCQEYMSTTSAPETTSEKLLAIIKLDEAEQIIFNGRVGPVTLPPQNNRSSSFFRVFDNSFIFATGYLTNNTTPTERTADVLRYLVMKLVRFNVCFRRLPENTKSNSSICTMGTDVIFGDYPKGSLCTEIGVPLVILKSKTLIGIFDSADSNCTKGGPALFIKIESFVDWINEHLV